MINIHILPTDKPSRIYLIKSNNKLGITSDNPEFTENFGSGTQNQNIYITNDEKIKEVDWRLDIRNGNVYKSNKADSESYDNTFRKKIILTTDQDLIKDGVQAIDNEFLEWFVKNPSCESVEIKSNWHMFSNKDAIKNYGIIIPKEEPNPFELPKSLPDDVFYSSLESKQETLEEAFSNYVNEKYHSPIQGSIPDLESAIFGAKWQQEQDRWKTVFEETPPSNIELLAESPDGVVHLTDWRAGYQIFSCQVKSESSDDWKWKTI
jgi:hypothetical protein